jgi:hypothetical protein
MTQEEHNIQAACVRWFGYAHPELRGLLFSVPNGGARSKATAGRLKAEGVVAGVSDLILLVPQWFTTWRGQEGCSYAGLCIEMKKNGGYQSPEQKEWQKKVEGHGYKYAVCRSLDEFIDTIEAYLR